MVKLKVVMDVGAGGIALTVVRSLGRKGIDVTVCARKKHDIAIYSRYCRDHLYIPSTKKNPDEFIKKVLEQVKREKYDLIFPLGVNQTLLISQHREKFLPYARIPLVKHEILLKANNKIETLEIAMEKEAKSTWTTINTWFSTHPPTFKRILLLREIEDEMNTGRYSSSRIYAHI